MLPPAAFRVRYSLFGQLPTTAEFDAVGFAGATGAVLVLLLLLARASQSMIEGDGAASEPTDGVAGSMREPRNPATAPEPPGPSDGPERADRNRPDRNGFEPDATGYGPAREAGDERQIPPDRDPESPARGNSPAEHRPERPPAAAPRDDRLDDPRSTPGGTRDVRTMGSEVDRTRGSSLESMTTAALLANVAFSHGLLATLLVGAAILTAVPAAALGLHVPATSDLVVGAALGTALFVASDVGAALSERLGLGRDETLRELLAPDSTAGWVLLLGGVLPVIAGFEELLFRGALIGAISVGFGVSPWLLAVLSSVAFGLGHGVQGASGIVVTGALGFVLAVAFVLTGSLVVVIVAHYLVNALEFLVHEWLGIEWLGGG